MKIAQQALPKQVSCSHYHQVTLLNLACSATSTLAKAYMEALPNHMSCSEDCQPTLSKRRRMAWSRA